MRAAYFVVTVAGIVAVAVTPGMTRAGEARDARPEFTTATHDFVRVAYTVDDAAARGTSAKAAPGEAAGQEAIFQLGESRPVSSLAIDVNVEFTRPNGIVRVVVLDQDANEYLVYETYPALEDGSQVRAQGVCEETCQVERLVPVELRVQAVGARAEVTRLLLGTASYPEDPRARRRAQSAYKIDRINAKFASGRVPWQADHTSMSELTYAQKRRMFLGWKQHLFLPNLQGFELYRDGVFDVAGASSGSGAIPVSDQDMACGAPTKVFDWRSRHGRNYMTSVKNQGSCGSCWAFAAVGAAEARINTYYNQLLNVDLAEQDSVCYTGNHEYEGTCVLVPVYATYADGCNGGEPQGTYEVLTSVGLPLEANMPYFASHDPGLCSAARAAAAGTPRWFATSIEGGARNEGAVKDMLTRGPVTVCLDSWSHCMVIAGYEEYSCGTRWILKNEWGLNYGQAGYVRVTLDLGDVSWQSCGLSDVTIRAPRQMVPSDGVLPTVVCEDRDGDTYCNWGTGPRPSTCPTSCLSIEDPDDAAFTCAPGFANCDGDMVSNRCEVNLSFDNQNCGACGHACGSTQRCNDGVCEFAGCTYPLKQCCDFARCVPLSYRCPICP